MTAEVLDFSDCLQFTQWKILCHISRQDIPYLGTICVHLGYDVCNAFEGFVESRRCGGPQHLSGLLVSIGSIRQHCGIKIISGLAPFCCSIPSYDWRA